MHPIKDLAALGLVGLLEKIGDLGGFEPAEPAGQTSHGIGVRVADQRLERLPIAGRMPAGALDQPEQPWWAAGVQPRRHPPGAGVFQFDVVGAHQLHGCHVDQSVPEHIGAQQHLTVAALKAAKVNLVLGQHNSVRSELVEWICCR